MSDHYGFDVGFPLTNKTQDPRNQQCWDLFIADVKNRYKNDSNWEFRPNYLVLKLGEQPKLPLECHKFLRFSSSGADLGNPLWKYLSAVKDMATNRLGPIIKWWQQVAGRRTGYHSWADVQRSYASFDDSSSQVAVGSSLHGASNALPVAGPSAAMQNSGSMRATTNFRALSRPSQPSQNPGYGQQFPIASSTQRTSDGHPFQVQNIVGKGRGLVATTRIPRGTLILREEAFFLGDRNKSDAELQDDMVSNISSVAFRRYASLFRTFRSSFGGGAYEEGLIFKSNALPVGLLGPHGMLEHGSLINHSCRPNAYHSTSKEDNSGIFHAIVDIEKGEEITIWYDIPEGPFSERQAALQDKFGFTCVCQACTLPEDQRRTSDRRRVAIQIFMYDFEGIYRSPDVSQDDLIACLKACYDLRDAGDDEYGTQGAAAPLRARLYEYAYGICGNCNRGEIKRQCIFANRAYDYRKICEGEDSTKAKQWKDQYETLKRIIEAEGGFPRYASQTEFEDWLFMRDLKV